MHQCSKTNQKTGHLGIHIFVCSVRLAWGPDAPQCLHYYFSDYTTNTSNTSTTTNTSGLLHQAPNTTDDLLSNIALGKIWDTEASIRRCLRPIHVVSWCSTPSLMGCVRVQCAYHHKLQEIKYSITWQKKVCPWQWEEYWIVFGRSCLDKCCLKVEGVVVGAVV